MDDALARDRRIFAPTPQRITLRTLHGPVFDTELYSFLDIPGKDALTVAALEDEIRAAPTGGWPALIGHLQQIVALVCPDLEPGQVDALSIQQMQDVIAAAHGAPSPLPAPEARAPASPSASGAFTTTSP